MKLVRLLGSVLLVFLVQAPAVAQDAFDLSAAVLEGGSPSIADRGLTATITQVNFTAGGVVIDFTKRDGAFRWPDVVPPGWDGPVEYTLWIGMQQQGRWHVCSVIEFWFGRGLDADTNAGGDVTRDQQIQRNWTYFCGPMARQPNPGEPIAFVVTAGDQRRMDVAAVRERSNVVVVPFPASAPAVFPMSAPPIPTPTPAPSPVPVPVPLPAPLPSIDLSAVLLQLQMLDARLMNLASRVEAVNEQVQAGRDENKAFYETVRSTWKATLGKIAPYLGTAIAAILAGRATK